jgi:Ca2+-binding RTX toxin-like protein
MDDYRGGILVADTTGTGLGESLTGTEEADWIRGLGGKDFISGRGGNDQLEGGDGDDSLYGDLGDDLLLGGAGNDTLGESTGGNDDLFGEAGNDYLYYYSGIPTADALLDGGADDDVLTYYQFDYASLATVSLIGGSGADRIESTTRGGGHVTIDAGAGADLVEINNYRADYTITLGADADILLVLPTEHFQFSPDAEIEISDFAAGDSGDALALIPFLANNLRSWNLAANPFAQGYLRVQQRGADAVLQFDLDAGNATYAFADFIVLRNVSAATLTAHNLSGYAANGSATAGIVWTGLATSDFATGTSGNDTLRGLDGADVLLGGAGADLLEGGAGDDRLLGEAGDDVVRGGAGNDTLDDRIGGNDQLSGEDGDDSLSVDLQWINLPNQQVVLDGGSGNDRIDFHGIHLQHDATLTGGTGNDFITSYLGRNVTIDAGEGNDYVSIHLSTGNAVITLGAGADELAPYVLTDPTFPIVGFTVTDFQAGDGGDRLYLNVMSVLLSGWDQASNPFAEGFLRLARDGASTTLLYDPSGEGATYSVLGRFLGTDASLFTAANFYTYDHPGYAPGTVATAGTDGADTLVGGALADELIGLGGNDTLIGGAGADRLVGGSGDDVYFVDNAGDQVIEVGPHGVDTVYTSIGYTLAAGAGVEVLSFSDRTTTNALSLTGNNLGQVIFGNAGANVLTGGGGSDTLLGLGGNDTLVGSAGAASTLQGGTGDDWYFVFRSGDSLVEFTGEGNDRLFAGVNYTLSAGQAFETLSTLDAASTTAVNLTGNELSQIILGNAGANVLSSGGGADTLLALGGNDTLIGNANAASTLQGGAGDDWYFVLRTGDSLVELAGEGSDRLFAGVDYTLSASQAIETLNTLDAAGATAINLAGNELDQLIIGNAGANVLNGGGGADTLLGLGGNDILLGGDGDDQLSGGLGADQLDGGAGADLMAFSEALGGGNVDTLVGFTSGQDRLFLENDVFTGLAAGGLAAGAFATGTAAADADDRIVYDAGTGSLWFDADGSGAGAAVLFATLTPGSGIVAGDIVVV